MLDTVTPAAPPSLCDDCPVNACRFRPAVVRAYLHAYRQAEIIHEDPADVIRDDIRNSRDVDPWIPRGRADRMLFVDIVLSLERARDVGGIGLTPHNADRVSAYLCPERWDEGC